MRKVSTKVRSNAKDQFSVSALVEQWSRTEEKKLLSNDNKYTRARVRSIVSDIQERALIHALEEIEREIIERFDVSSDAIACDESGRYLRIGETIDGMFSEKKGAQTMVAREYLHNLGIITDSMDDAVVMMLYRQMNK